MMAGPLELRDFLTLFGTALSLLLSASALYLGQFRRPRVSVAIGPEIHVYYTPNGGGGVYLPVLFRNRSPSRAIIDKAYLVIQTPKGEHFGMRWLESAEIKWPEVTYTQLGRARPFKLDGFDAVTNVFWFFHPRTDTLPNIEWAEGDYFATLYVWTTDDREPNVETSERFTISPDHAGPLAEHLAAKVSNTRYIYFKDRGLISFVTGAKKPRFSAQRTD